MNKILFIGAGAIATAMGNVLAKKLSMDVTLVTIEDEVAGSISRDRVNQKYFPNIVLEKELKTSTDFSILKQQAIVFIAIPSVVIVDFMAKQEIHPGSILVNLAKGFGDERRTIVECLVKKLPNPVCTMKGPSFAREIINNQPTAFTVGAENEGLYDELDEVFRDTTIQFVGIIIMTDNIQIILILIMMEKLM